MRGCEGQRARWRRAMTLGWILLAVGAGPAQAGQQSGWAVGWDDGLTVRREVAGDWIVALSAGPDDHLTKTEIRRWSQATPAALQGVLEVPDDTRQEQGWVRLQVGRHVARRADLALTAFAGLAYNWIDAQVRSLVLDDLTGDYDTFERDRFTEHWILAGGLRPSWRPTEFLTIEFAFGLRFVWDSWQESSVRTAAGGGEDRATGSGHGRSFQDFGWDGVSSLQFFFWF